MVRRAGGRSDAADSQGMSAVAVDQCLAALRAACHRPIHQAGLDTVVGWLRPQFDRILDHPDGAGRWAEHGHIMRDNARHIGALADFFAHRADARIVGIDELTRAFEMVRAACQLRVTRRQDDPSRG
jgi:hypothetical protein